MRTTVTIEDKTAARLDSLARESGKSFSQVVNETLLRGLEQRKSTQRRKSYKVMPVKMGEPRPEYDLTKALSLADNLEDTETARKLALRK
ncbi:MAG: CopG family transcriptional regulator [Gammaproteobacteria bacterium]|nr:CopG family transcriptional regulator [Gammaproteobacteria bacterium]MYH85579.1 CopG family transcriptional regulator [Gammaproteobacteria bacterium]MYK05135.1 CopG family transcriptional regulator [Gammaproteobacteria bacterium]